MSQFDTKFTKQTPIDSPISGDCVLSESANQVFLVCSFTRLPYSLNASRSKCPPSECPRSNSPLVKIVEVEILQLYMNYSVD